MSQWWMFAIVLVGFHTPDGRAVFINPDEITSLSSKRPPQDEHLMTGEVNCVINLADGKFVSVTESCAEVRERVGEKL